MSEQDEIEELPTLDYICDACNVQQHAEGTCACANCGTKGVRRQTPYRADEQEVKAREIARDIVENYRDPAVGISDAIVVGIAIALTTAYEAEEGQLSTPV